MLTHKELQERLSYDSGSGLFKWLNGGNGKLRGGTAGCLMKSKYVCIRIDNKLFYAHRLAWLYTTGDWPANQIDHINLDRSDNRMCNLREATLSENNRNTKVRSDSKSGIKGAYKNRRGGRYYSKIMFNGVIYRLGSFSTAEEAHKAYCDKADELFGEFANYG